MKYSNNARKQVKKTEGEDEKWLDEMLGCAGQAGEYGKGSDKSSKCAGCC